MHPPRDKAGHMGSIIPRDFPSIRQLRSFEAVARLQSLSSAAREINLSQPGLTQAIRALEGQLNGRLFDRRRSGCYTTELGAIFFPRVQRFFSHMWAALHEAGHSSWARREVIDAVVRRISKPQIRSLIAISESQSFDAAARSLRISEPSLHRSARTLERELRRSLYQRTAHGMTTTPYGYELARRYQVALREIEYALEELQAARGKIVSHIAVGHIPHSATQILSYTIKEFLAKYPAASVQILDGHYDDLLNALRAGRLDLLFGVLRRPDWAIDIKEELLFANPYVIVARSGHPLTRLKQPNLRHLANYDWIMPGPMTPRQQALQRMFGSLPDAVRISIETTSLQIYRTILATTDRLTLMSRFEAQLNDNRFLAVLPFRSPHLRRSDGIATRLGWEPTSIHLHFLDILRAEACRLGANAVQSEAAPRLSSRPA
jgi:LysR family transcriptional regulator, regulator for genes of the gallate degradation pathway